MKDSKRVILMVLDSVSIGEMPDAAEYGDEGSNTLAGILYNNTSLNIPNMAKLGLYNIDGVKVGEKQEKTIVIRKQIQEIKLELPHKMSNRTIIPNKWSKKEEIKCN